MTITKESSKFFQRMNTQKKLEKSEKDLRKVFKMSTAKFSLSKSKTTVVEGSYHDGTRNDEGDTHKLPLVDLLIHCISDNKLR